MESVGAEGWETLPTPWRAAFELAWDSLLAGSPPVGAVLVGPDGAIVGRGRSRRAERSAPAGQLAGSRLAHAEVNALASLPVDAGRDHVLYVTLEPCFLCTAAITVSHVGSVRFAGSDPMWRFLQDLSDAHPELKRRDYVREGPMLGPFGAWGALLPLVDRLMRDPTGTRVDAFEADAPDLVDLAKHFVSSGRIDELVRMSPEHAVSAVWADLVRLGDQVP